MPLCVCAIHQAKEYLKEMAEKSKANRSPQAMQQQLQFQQPMVVQSTNTERYSLLSGGERRASSPPLVPKPLSVVLSICFLLQFIITELYISLCSLKLFSLLFIPTQIFSHSFQFVENHLPFCGIILAVLKCSSVRNFSSSSKIRSNVTFAFTFTENNRK